MEELGNSTNGLERFKASRTEGIHEVKVAFTPLAYDVIMRIEVHNGDLYDRLLRILDRDELHIIVRDALMYSTSCLFESFGFNLLRSQAEIAISSTFILMTLSVITHFNY